MNAVICSVLLFALSACRCDSSNYSFIYYPKFHLGPKISFKSKQGWMNDPNGFSYFNGSYHLFYQYNPESSLDAGTAHWGHAISKDLVCWEHLPVALYPDKPYDKDGVFSGSVLIEDDVMYLYYTGNVNNPGQSPDHKQVQALATSVNAETFTKLDQNPIIIADDRQPNIRDPKVWKHDDTYYMVLGNSFKNDTLGRVLLYASKDKVTWEEVSILAESDGSLGYMWECPDFFELDGIFVLLMSPQGIPKDECSDNFRNLYSVGYLIGTFDYVTRVFTPKTRFMELDHGHDFYATQTMLDPSGRRIAIAWLDMWKQNYPERLDGFTGQMTMARTLSVKNNRLIQKPVKEMAQAVGKKLYSDKAGGGTKVKLTNKIGKIEIISDGSKDLTFVIESERVNETLTISYDSKKGQVTLDRGGHDGVRRTKYRPMGKLRLVVYTDRSSIELYWGEGEVTMSSRFFFYGLALYLRLLEDCQVDHLIASEMKQTVDDPSSYIS